MVKNLPAVQDNQVQSLGREDPLANRMATPLQYSCLEDSMDRGYYSKVTKSRTQLSD